MNCPICLKSGSVPRREPGTSTRCPLCWGVGTIPPLHVIREDEKDLALYYWECSCCRMIDGQMYQRVHPDNHDVCSTCDMTSNRAKLALAGYVWAFFANIYRLDLDFVYL